MTQTQVTSATRAAPYRLLDAWRGVASLAVVAFHWAEVALRTTPDRADNWFYQACSYGFLGVQIFFVISGFCIAAAACAALNKQQASGASAGSVLRLYLTARARRIFPTYWAGLALVLLFSFAATQMARAGKIPENIYTNFNAGQLFSGTMLANLTLTGTPLHEPMYLAVAWTLCYEAAFYLVIGAALAFVAWRNRTEGAGSVLTLLNVLHGVTLASLTALLLFPQNVPFPLELWPQFGLGVFVYDLLTPTPQSTPIRRRKVWAAFWASLALLFAFVIFRNVNVGTMAQAARLAFPTSAFFALLLLVLHPSDKTLADQKGLRVLGFVGLFSYSLYLTHTVVLRIAGQVLQKAHVFPRFEAASFFIVTAACLVFRVWLFLLV